MKQQDIVKNLFAQDNPLLDRYFRFEATHLLRGRSVSSVSDTTPDTPVLITVDTEFSANHCFRDAGRRPETDQAVFCNINGKSHGLGFLLDTFKTYSTKAKPIKATFFVEAAHVVMLGMDGPAIDAIVDAGHDVQLHIHPLWMKGVKSNFPRTDSMAKLDEGQCRFLVDTGLDAFQKWGVPTPSSFRAGNLQMGKAAYRALKSCGILISSSISTAVNSSSDTALQLGNGRHIIEGVNEITIRYTPAP